MSESSVLKARYFSAERAVEYIRSRGFESVTENTLRHASYNTKKLARPKVVGNCAHWAQTDLDAWIDSL